MGFEDKEMNILNKFKSSQEDLQFIDTTKIVWPHYPPILAKKLPPLKDRQMSQFNSYTFMGCPGMFDYASMGYIIPAWCNFHIKANKAGSIAIIGSKGEDFEKRRPSFYPPHKVNTPLINPNDPDIEDKIVTPKNMDVGIIRGLLQPDGTPPVIWSFPGVWKLDGKPNVSALIMPAFYHSTFLDDLYVYPGVVDYHGFYTINFVCTPKRKCEVEIKAGDPILQVIPFITNKDFNASYGPPEREQAHKFKLTKWFHEKNFYRRFLMVKKVFKLKKRVSE